MIRPYLLFGGDNVPHGGMSDYLGAHFSVDEARAVIDGGKLAWWQIAVVKDESLEIVASSDAIPETPTVITLGDGVSDAEASAASEALRRRKRGSAG